MGVKCFFLEPSGKLSRELRRYHSIAENEAPCPLMPPQPNWRGYHNAITPLDVIEDGNPDGTYSSSSQDAPSHDDPRWPTTCGCGYQFTDADEYQLSAHRLYRRTDTGEEMALHDAPVGAMWFADWMLSEGSNHYRGPDGHCLVVRCPDKHDWTVDGRANNCTMGCKNCGAAYSGHDWQKCKQYDPQDDGEHKCWVRHGDPRTGNITVDKNGLTCNAGGGSIDTGHYHGFLRSGEFT